MNQKQILNVSDFDKAVTEVRNGRVPFIGEQYQELYRGQSKNSYRLESGIARYAKSVDELKKLEQNIVSDFKNLISESENPNKFIQLSINDDESENNWRWLEQIQHYRLPTRLLDWTLDPKIALFFAVERNPDDTGQFWIFKSPLTWSNNDHFELNPYSDELDIISNSSFYIEDGYKDKIAENRRSFQSGKFTFQDYRKSQVALENQLEMKSKLIKYEISPEAKKDFIKYLADFNITEDSIYVKYDEEIEKLISSIKEKYNLR